MLFSSDRKNIRFPAQALIKCGFSGIIPFLYSALWIATYKKWG
jgi:hypothetical protein